MIPSSRPKLSDLYTLSQSKSLENHTLHSGTYLYSPYMEVTPPPPGLNQSITGLSVATSITVFVRGNPSGICRKCTVALYNWPECCIFLPVFIFQNGSTCLLYGLWSSSVWLLYQWKCRMAPCCL